MKFKLKKIYENPPKNVKFVGIIPRDEMNDMYNLADILFMPSYNELFPMSILEAVNSEKPLLLRNLSLYEDILFKKYMSADDNEGFIKNIKELKDNPKTYQKFSNMSKEISDYYSKSHVGKLWVDYYQKIYRERSKEK